MNSTTSLWLWLISKERCANPIRLSDKPAELSQEALPATARVRCVLEAVADEEHPLERAGIAERALQLLVLPSVLGWGDFPCLC